MAVFDSLYLLLAGVVGSISCWGHTPGGSARQGKKGGGGGASTGSLSVVPAAAIVEEPAIANAIAIALTAAGSKQGSVPVCCGWAHCQEASRFPSPHLEDCGVLAVQEIPCSTIGN